MLRPLLETEETHVMRPVPGCRIVFLVVAAIVFGACDSGEIPTDPTPAPTVTETFSGTLTPNGAAIHQFSVSSVKGGGVTATITTLSPETATIGFSLGTWNTVFCTTTMDNPSAGPAFSLSARTLTPASLCLRVYDAIGTVPADTGVTYTVEVVHP
jgi:hypothetical protein